MNTAVRLSQITPTHLASENARWGPLESYVVILILSSGLIFLPGSDLLRPVIRGLPYAVSLAFLAWHLSARSHWTIPPGAKWILLALFLYAANLGHPLTDLQIGVPVVAFHLAVIAPILWAGPLVRGPNCLHKLLWVFLLTAMVHVVVGMLQAAFPLVFMPAQFMAVPEVLAEQTYRGPFGREIVRLPGLTDLPAGASEAGTLASLLGLAFAVRDGERLWIRLFGVFALVPGLFVLYLTQVRSQAIMAVLALALFGGLAFWQGRSRLLLTAGMGTIFLALLAWLRRQSFDPSNPYGPGGHFQELAQQGLFSAYMENRGLFLRQTFGELLSQYPLGAGLGRWGTMRQYFGRNTSLEEIWVEIQPTGWLLDGGVPMWILYGGAVGAAMLYSLRLALRKANRELAFVAAIVVSLQFAIVGAGMGGPVFNTIFGITFWLLAAVLYALGEFDRRAPWIQRGTLESASAARTTDLRPSEAVS